MIRNLILQMSRCIFLIHLFFLHANSIQAQELSFQKSQFQEFPLYFVKNSPKKIIAENQKDVVDFICKLKNENEFAFYINEEKLSYFRKNDSIITILIPEIQKDSKLGVFYKSKLIKSLDLFVTNKTCEKVNLINLSSININIESTQVEINRLLQPFQKEIFINIVKLNPKIYNKETAIVIPKNKQFFSGQMRAIRESFFKKELGIKQGKIVVLVDEFKDTNLISWSIKDKALMFVKVSKIENLAKTIFTTFLNCYSNHDENKNNIEEIDIKYFIDHFSINSYYDDYENVKTNNGLVAYYFWEETKSGKIKLNENFLSSIKRPYKQNFLAFHFQLKYPIFKPFVKFHYWYISLFNVLYLIIVLVLFFTIRKYIKLNLERKLFKFIKSIAVFVCIIFINYYGLSLGNKWIEHFTLVSGNVPELNNVAYKKAKSLLLKHDNVVKKSQTNLHSEILVKKNNIWTVKKRQQVLYFEIKGKDLFYIKSSDTLYLPDYQIKEKAKSHYMVLNENGKTFLYNHLGVNITEQLKNEDIPKRILVFVNGYRPTSIGNSLKENFDDVSKSGLEYPDSKNVIFDFDRYDYWERWNQINNLFIQRINPARTYYADGHHSVSTSNYRSLVEFSTLSSLYPERCKNPKKHTCYEWKYKKYYDFFSSNKTINQLKKRPNYKGFIKREQNGKTAGLNLNQLLNELPNNSQNDTLFIVCHSMGFAYAKGIIEKMRGKINFGSLYIITPENASVGHININEWNDVWQYGSRFNLAYEDAPCLQDGVAPQYSVMGLSINNRVFIPKNQYAKKGFFDSHFIGYYTWIFDIKENNKGFVKQH